MRSSYRPRAVLVATAAAISGADESPPLTDWDELAGLEEATRILIGEEPW
jgi:hypothetical protein